MNHEKYLEELRSKETLTDKEMNDLIRLSPPGSFKSGPNLKALGVADVDRAFKNLREGPERNKRALENGCYLEVISLRLQHIELWLRMFWVARNKKGKILDPNDKRTFGVVVNDCAVLGFRPDLVVRMKEFNEHRINALHKYLLGATDYVELKEVCEENTGLDMESQCVCPK